ncbi:S41 family peptidase [Undibacterium squillarum]|uniref:Peptidase S41 n=1 Tax=Undibacterium squillarum TaxID=1131567 RepID=A0ABQ2XWJ0_9BURK|nr:S41 family peptidase [Undibacterium squillarum]GGX37921.1 peptidase S41 [Undibacterium squillarum]
MGSKFKNLGLIGLGMVAGVAVSMQFSALAQKEATQPIPLKELQSLSNVFGLIKSSYVEPVEDSKLISDAISGMVTSLDPHSAYLDKKSFKDLNESTQGRFVGLGIEVGMEDGYVKVVSPIEDSPAYRAGLKPGDLITRLDSQPVKGLTLDEAVKKMRGEPNTKITLTIARKTEDKPIVVTITREVIKQQSVKAKIVEPGYAWLRISQFQEPTVDDMVKKLQGLYAQDPNIKGLVLDLRNDPGGVLPGAIGVSAAFLPKDVAVVSTKGQMDDQNVTYYARREYYSGRTLSDPLSKLPEAVKNVPMVVLINTGSASASEIVAGALQDYKRATIMGTQSFGKGSVQSIIRFPVNAKEPDFAVKLTTARYYTPKDRSIQARGIEPDLLVEETAEGDGLNTFRSREADLQKHLSNDKDKEISRPKVDEQEEEKKLLELAKKVKPLEYGSKEDFQLSQALNHLKGLPVKLAERKEKDADAKSEKSEKTEKSEKSDKTDKSHGGHSEPKKK